MAIDNEPRTYRFVDQEIIDDLRGITENQQDRIDTLQSEAESLKDRLNVAEKKISQYEERQSQHENYDFRVSVIVVSTLNDHQRPLAADEVFYVSNGTEALAKEREIQARQSQLKRKIMICKEASVKAVAF